MSDLHPRPKLPVAFVAESNMGGIPVHVCACGVLLYGGSDIAWEHVDRCAAWAAFQEGVTG